MQTGHIPPAATRISQFGDYFAVAADPKSIDAEPFDDLRVLNFRERHIDIPTHQQRLLGQHRQLIAKLVRFIQIELRPRNDGLPFELTVEVFMQIWRQRCSGHRG